MAISIFYDTFESSNDPNLKFDGANVYIIRESVDSLCRDGADTQYMQYLSKSRITSPQTRKKLI